MKAVLRAMDNIEVPFSEQKNQVSNHSFCYLGLDFSFFNTNSNELPLLLFLWRA